MSRFQPSVTRVEIDQDEEMEDGLLYASGRGRAGEGPRRVLWAQQHGFASRAPKGAVGVKIAMGGHHSTPLLFGGEHASHRPKIGSGDAALYDSHGNILKVFSGGAVFDLQSRQATFTAGGWTINGPVTINGDLQVNGNVNVSGSVIDGDGNNGA